MSLFSGFMLDMTRNATGHALTRQAYYPFDTFLAILFITFFWLYELVIFLLLYR